MPKRFLVMLFFIIYIIACHAIFLGYLSVDGFMYRVPPLIELVQNGSLGGEKFAYLFAQYANPFFELVHYPFLKLFGLPGLYFSFSLVLLPLGALAVYGFAKEIYRQSRSAFYASLIYLSLPFVNEQTFAGYIDFAVLGALAFFLFALLRTIRQPVKWNRWGVFILAGFIYSMSRPQNPYLAVLLTAGVLSYQILAEKQKISLFKTGSALLLGITPAASIQAYRFFQYGSPLYPYEFKVFGIVFTKGFSLSETMVASGKQSGFVGLLHNLADAWLLSPPISLFDSRQMGAGLLFWITLAAFFLLWRKFKWKKPTHRFFLFIVSLLIGLSLLTGDFWLPRYAMTLDLALILCVSAAFPGVFPEPETEQKSPIRRLVPRLLLAGLVCQLLLRPIYMGVLYKLDRTYLPPRANLLGSPWLIPSPEHPPLEIYPDGNYNLVIVSVDTEFYLPLYGRRLSNHISERLVEIDCTRVVGDLHSLAQNRLAGGDTLVVDQNDLLQKTCHLELKCALPGERFCLGYELPSENDIKDLTGLRRPVRSRSLN